MQVLRPHPEAIYKDTLDALKRVSSSPGELSKLWRGIWSVVIGAGPAHAIYFASYEQAKKMLLPRGEHAADHLIYTGLSGAIATSLADGFMTPFDVIKQRMQVHDSPYRNVFQCGLSIFRREGVSAFFISYPATLLLNIPFHMVQFPTYEFFRGKFLKPNGEYDPLSHITAGAISGGLAAALTTPIDVIKTTLQTRGIMAAGDDQINKIKGMKDAVNFVYKERGLAGFSRGMAPRVLTFMPATGICWGFYEYIKWLLDD